MDIIINESTLSLAKNQVKCVIYVQQCHVKNANQINAKKRKMKLLHHKPETEEPHNCGNCISAKPNYPYGILCDEIHKGKTTTIADWRHTCAEWEPKPMPEPEPIDDEIPDEDIEVSEKEIQEFIEDTKNTEVFDNTEIEEIENMPANEVTE